MANEVEEYRPEVEEEGGGPVKSFLDHLEDLRWTLVKCSAALIVGMIICLSAGNYLVNLLKRPLLNAAINQPSKDLSISVLFGTNLLGTFHPGTNILGALTLPTNQVYHSFQINPIRVTNGLEAGAGTEVILALSPGPTNFVPAGATSKIDLINLSPAGGFMVAFQIAIYGGLLLAAPLLIYFLGQFILPALHINEKKYALRGLAIGSLLFFAGVGFCYFVLMPMALNASVKYSEWLGFSANQWQAEEYISFVCKFMLGMGLGFELPVVILILVKLGIVNYQQLAGFRRYMIVINLVLGAVLTTPEVMTQVMMALPLQLLYEISVWIAWWWERKERNQARAQGYDS